MFTGIVKKIAEVKNIEHVRNNILITIDLEDLANSVKVGDSISVNGACLTVIGVNNNLIKFEIVEETLVKTNLAELKEGDKVNIELSCTPEERLSGHIVLGHVDCKGIIVKREDYEGSSKIWVMVPKDIMVYVVPKGPIAVDGVSLTVVDVEEDTFSFVLIPHTMSVTTLGLKKEGDKVNIEVDVIAKYVKNIIKEFYDEGIVNQSSN